MIAGKLDAPTAKFSKTYKNKLKLFEAEILETIRTTSLEKIVGSYKKIEKDFLL